MRIFLVILLCLLTTPATGRPLVFETNADNFQAYTQVDPPQLVIHYPDQETLIHPLKKPHHIDSAVLLPDEDQLYIRLTPSLIPDYTLHGALHLDHQPHHPDMVFDDKKLQELATKIKQTITKNKQPTKPIIVIDPGHGGHDPGAISHGSTQEKDITLSLAQHLANELRALKTYQIVLTRDHDRFINLYDRIGLAETLGAVLFISLHADSIAVGGQHVKGASFYTLAKKASDEQTARLVARENNPNGVDDKTNPSPFNLDFLKQLITQETNAESLSLAKNIYTEFKKANIPLLPKPLRSGDFAVLKSPDIPSVLIEVGFVSNAKEIKILQSNDYQKKLANIITQGIIHFLDADHKNAVRD